MDEAEAKASAASADATPDALTRHGLDATPYAELVANGEIIACRWVRLACERHLKDLERSKDPSYPYRFDPVKAGRICYWLELMPHTDGEWGSPTIILELWQKFCYGSIFGWVRKSDDRRRFTKAYISVPRKNAKTTALAGIGLFGLACDGEPGAQIYNGANKLEQAMLLFDPAKAMVEARPDIFSRLGIKKRGEKALWQQKSNSRWRPVSRKPGDGGGAHFWIQDEYHEAKDGTLADAMVQGQGARRQPLAIFITTAGYNIGGPCYSYELQIRKVLEGTISRERTFGIIYTIDLEKYTDPFGVEHEPDDWTSLDAAKKANPNWGVSVIEDTFLTELEEATQDPAKQTAFKTKRLNIWCNAAAGFYNMQHWSACADSSLSLDQFAGEPCLEGLDLANKLDLCAAVRVFCRHLPGTDPETGEPCLDAHYYAFLRAWLPKAVALKTENTHYQEWVNAGILKATKGNITNYGLILKELDDGAKEFRVEELDFDQREAGFLMQEFEKVNLTLPLFEVPQQVYVLSEPMKWLKSLIVAGRLHHDGNPLLAWAMSNVTAEEDHNKNVFPRKAADELKIDPHSALLNAMVRVREVLAQPTGDFEPQVWS